MESLDLRSSLRSLKGLFLLLLFHIFCPSKMKAMLRKALPGYDPKPDYEIPKYEEWMRVNNARDLYLRETKGCESRAPEIVALAYTLGADKLLEAEGQGSPDVAQRHQLEGDYADNVFKWVKNNIKYNMGGGTALETLEEGVGVSSTSLFIALCRAGGLKARWKISAEPDPRLKDLNELSKYRGKKFENVMSMLSKIAYGSSIAEVYIDGKWIPADPRFPDEFEAGIGYNISKLGYEPEWMKTEEAIYLEDYFSRVNRFILNYFKKMDGLKGLMDQGLGLYTRIGWEKLELGEEEYERRRKKSFKGSDEELSSILKRL